MMRLTTDAITKDMSMVELAHNCCYIGQDGWTRYRDFEIDITARDLTRKLMLVFGCWNEESMALVDDEQFDDEIMENGMYSLEEPEGLIAAFYRNLWAMADLREHLKIFEDNEKKWTLCEKELPKECGIYEVTIEKVINSQKQYITECVLFSSSGRWMHSGKVIAWKERTAPYIPEEA